MDIEELAKDIYYSSVMNIRDDWDHVPSSIKDVYRRWAERLAARLTVPMKRDGYCPTCRQRISDTPSLAAGALGGGSL